MAKFTISLCFMALVTSCVAQSSIFSAMADQVTGTVTSLVSETTRHGSMIVGAMTDATHTVEAFEEQVNREAQNVIADGTAAIGSLIASATGDASLCMAQSIDFKEMILGYASNAITCAKNALDKLLSKCIASLDLFKNYMNIFDNWTTKVTLCSSNIMTLASCTTLVWTSMQNEIPNIWASMLSQVALLSIEFTEFEVSLGLCGSFAAVTTLIAEAQKSQAAVAKCIMALK